MKLYFDIDGVLVGRGWKPAENVTEFLKVATEKHDCYWLTTHCQVGDVAEPMKYLADILDAEAIEYCKKIKPLIWKLNKAEAIDFNSDFLWFEDTPSEYEKEILSSHNKLSSLVLVDLIKNPNQLFDLIKIL